ncbi:MAG: DUF6438 domain-containing protein [Bacteroidia bacterium]
MSNKILISLTLLFAAFFVSCKTNSESVKQEILDWQLSVKKTPCFGECPVYKIVINGSGDANLEVVKFMKLREGAYASNIDEARLTKLNELLTKVSKKSYDDTYDSGFSDFPWTELSITTQEGDVLNVRFQNNTAPKELEEIGEIVDSIANERRIWKPAAL